MVSTRTKNNLGKRIFLQSIDPLIPFKLCMKYFSYHRNSCSNDINKCWKSRIKNNRGDILKNTIHLKILKKITMYSVRRIRLTLI